VLGVASLVLGAASLVLTAGTDAPALLALSTMLGGTGALTGLIGANMAGNIGDRSGAILGLVGALLGGYGALELPGYVLAAAGAVFAGALSLHSVPKAALPKTKC
jgi:hypothetical protein